MLLPKIKKIPKNTNGRLAIPALAGLLVTFAKAGNVMVSDLVSLCLFACLFMLLTNTYSYKQTYERRYKQQHRVTNNR